MKFASRKKLKRLRIVLVTLSIILISSGYYVAYIYGSDLSGRLLKETVDIQSEGFYQIDYDQIAISFINKELDVKNLILEPTTRNIGRDRTYRILIPELKIKLVSIFNIYLKKDLSFQKIGLKDPQIWITKSDTTHKKTTLSIESGDLYKLINQYLFKFSIDSLGIKNAMVDYSSADDNQLDLILKEIDFGIRNLTIDSTNSKQKFLYTDDIQLTLSNQKFDLSDSVHTLKFDAFELSTKSKKITFRNLSIKEVSDAAQGSHNRYDIEIPEINFRGIDFLSAYNQDRLQLDTVKILNPQVTVVSKNQSKIDQKDVPKLFFRLFEQVQFSRFFIVNGKLNLKMQQKDKHQSIQSDQLNLSIQQFEMDSSHLSDPLHLAYFQHFKLDTRNLHIRLPDSSHYMSIDKLHASSLDSSLILNNLSIRPLTGVITTNQLSTSIPEVKITGLDYARAWLMKSIHAHDLRLTSPTINSRFIMSKSNAQGMRLIKSVKIDSVHITEGSLDLQLNKWQLITDGLTTDLSSIRLSDSTDFSKLNRAFNAKKLMTNGFKLTNEEQEIIYDRLITTDQMTNTLIRGISYKHKGDDHPLLIDKLALTGFQLDALFNKKIIQFDTLIIGGPKVNINLSNQRKMDQDKINDLIHKLSFNKVLINGGHVNIFKNHKLFSHLDSISATLSSFHYDSLVNEYFTGIDFKADSFHISMPDIGHGLSGKGIKISQYDSTLDVLHIALTPYPSDSIFNHYRIASEELKLQHLNFHKLLNTGEVEFKSGILQSPKVQITIENSTPRKSDKKRDPIRFESMNIKNGNLSFQNKITGLTIQSNRFNAQADNFDLLNDTSLFFAQNYLFDALSTTIGIRKLHDSIRVGKAQLNSNTGYLKLNDVMYTHDNNLGITLEGLELKGFKTDHLISDNILRMDSMILDKPEVKLRIKQSKKSPQSKPPVIEIAGIKVRRGLVKLFREDLNEGDTLALKDLTLNINGFTYDSTALIKFSHHLFESFDLSGSSFAYNLPDGLSRVFADKYAYNHTSKTVLLDDVRYTPIYNRGEFQTKIEYQKDWLNGSIKQIMIRGFEMDSLISHDKIQATGINIQELTLDTHRDKRLPKEPDVHKPLPQSLLRSLNYRVQVDSVVVKSSYVSHSEFSENGELPGLIYFKDLNARLTNVTNDPELRNQNKTLGFDATGSLMNTGNFELSVNFDLEDTLDGYQLAGRIGSMELSELNEFLEHTAFVLIRDGVSKEATFEFDGNENYSIGQMTFYYDKLKINVLDQENYNTKGFSASIKTFFANTFVVNTKNPYFIFVRNGDIFHERDKSKSIFNYWAKSLLSGVVSSIGAKNNKKTIRNQNEEIRSKFDNFKKSHPQH